MKVDVKKQFQGRSYRVKGIDLHPTEPWILCSLFTGTVQIWNYETQSLVRSVEVSNTPVRACRFIARKNWIVVGGDDTQIRVFNSNTLEKVTQFEAHLDYIRTIAVHPTQPFLLTAGDDMVIKLWNWEQNWKNAETFRGHTSYVMYVAINPKDPNTFASACMDRTVKVWSFSSPAPNFTLVAHETKGVNFVEYYPFADKPYLLTTSDDATIRIFDYQSKACVATLSGHANNVSFAIFHPESPIIISGSEDSTIKIWNARSYRLEQTINFGMERAWCVAARQGSSTIAMGFETGNLLLQFGTSQPAVSMDSSGKLVWVKHLEAFSASIKPQASVDDQSYDSSLSLAPKDLGTVEIQPSQLLHSPNGRFVAVCGDGEYIMYTALAWRNKAFGQATSFAWAPDSSTYAIGLDDGSVRAHRNFAEISAGHFDIEFSVSKVWGGALLGATGEDFIAFYDWETGRLVSRVDVEAIGVYWSDNGDLLTIITDTELYILRYDRDLFLEESAKDESSEDGIEGVFEVLSSSRDRVQSGKWIGDCFVFTSHTNRLNYVVGEEVYNITHYDREIYLLGYLPRDNAVYLCDKNMQVYAAKLSLAVVEYQTVVLRGDLEYAAELLEKVPDDERNRVAQFMEAQGHTELALDITRDPDHRFDLAMRLNKLQIAEEVAQTQEMPAKWKALGDSWLKAWQLSRAEACYVKAADLDTLLLFYTSTGNKGKLAGVAEQAVERGMFNLAYNAYWHVGDVENAARLLARSGRHAEAALFSLTYGGDVQSHADAWKSQLKDAGQEKIAALLCDPKADPGKFPENVGAKTEIQAAEPLIEFDDVDDEELESGPGAATELQSEPEAVNKDTAANVPSLAPEKAPVSVTEPEADAEETRPGTELQAETEEPTKN